KKSYHSIAVPTVDAMTARRSCLWCSTGESCWKAVTSVVAMAFLPPAAKPKWGAARRNDEKQICDRTPQQSDSSGSSASSYETAALNFCKVCGTATVPSHFAAIRGAHFAAIPLVANF